MKKILIASMLACSFSSFADVDVYKVPNLPASATLSGTDQNTVEYCGISIVKSGDGESAIYSERDMQYLSTNTKAPEIIVYNNDPSKRTVIDMQATLTGVAVANVDKSKVVGEFLKISDNSWIELSGIDSGVSIVDVDQASSHNESYRIGLNLNSVKTSIDQGDINAKITLTISCS